MAEVSLTLAAENAPKKEDIIFCDHYRQIITNDFNINKYKEFWVFKKGTIIDFYFTSHPGGYNFNSKESIFRVTYPANFQILIECRIVIFRAVMEVKNGAILGKEENAFINVEISNKYDGQDLFINKNRFSCLSDHPCRIELKQSEAISSVSAARKIFKLLKIMKGTTVYFNPMEVNKTPINANYDAAEEVPPSAQLTMHNFKLENEPEIQFKNDNYYWKDNYMTDSEPDMWVKEDGIWWSPEFKCELNFIDSIKIDYKCNQKGILLMSQVSKNNCSLVIE